MCVIYIPGNHSNLGEWEFEAIARPLSPRKHVGHPHCSQGWVEFGIFSGQSISFNLLRMCSLARRWQMSATSVTTRRLRQSIRALKDRRSFQRLSAWKILLRPLLDSSRVTASNSMAVGRAVRGAIRYHHNHHTTTPPPDRKGLCMLCDWGKKRKRHPVFGNAPHR